MSTTFDDKFEVWLNEQLNSIKSLTTKSFVGRQQPRAPREQSQLRVRDIAGTRPTSYRSTASAVAAAFDMSRSAKTGRDVTSSSSSSKRGNGNYYRFAYDDDDDVQSFDDVDDGVDENENDDDDDERRRRQRLSRILGDRCLDFESETALEMDDEIATTNGPPRDENRNLFGGSGDKMAASRVNQYSTTSLEFSDTESFVSATGSDATDNNNQSTQQQQPDDWTIDDGGEGYTGGGLGGFVEFSRVRDETGSGERTLTAAGDDDEDDPVQYRATRPPSGAQSKLLTAGLISAISGRGLSARMAPSADKAAPTTGRRLDDMVAVKYHKATSSGEPSGGEYMDDDDMLVHPYRHQLPVGVTSPGVMTTTRNEEYNSAARSFLPTDLSLDIMSTDDAYNTPDFDDAASDDVGLHSKDRDPIVRTPSSGPRSPGSRSLPQQFARTLSDATSGRASSSRWCARHRRVLLIAVGALAGVLLLAGVAVAIYFIVRPS